MNKLTIQLAENRAEFRPRELVRGEAEWELPKQPARVEVRLCWLVEVQGVGEVRRVDTLRYDHPQASDRRKFEFRLPDGPYSYAGTLSALSWVVELAVLPEREFTHAFFSMGPHGQAVDLRSQETV